MKSYPLVSVIVLNWNGKKWLEQCLKSLSKITYPKVEIMVVNNGSTDDSGEFIRKHYPKVRLVELEKNIGFAGANNLGVRQAKGMYVVLLNNDTTVTPGFIEPLLNDLEKNEEVGAVQPQIRSMIDKSLLDSVGSYLTSTGYLYHFGYGQPYKEEIYSHPLKAYSIKGACMMMRRREYLALGGLDESFICYVEETDLCHRVWLSGKSVIYEPRSVIYHYGGRDMSVMTKSEVTIYRNFRNRMTLFFKNLSPMGLLRILPIYIIVSELYILATLLRGRIKAGLAAQLGMVGWIKGIQDISEKRAFIQGTVRKITDRELNKSIVYNPPLSYYIHFFKDPEGRYNEKELGEDFKYND